MSQSQSSLSIDTVNPGLCFRRGRLAIGLLLARSIMLLLHGKPTYSGCSVFPATSAYIGDQFVVAARAAVVTSDGVI